MRFLVIFVFDVFATCCSSCKKESPDVAEVPSSKSIEILGNVKDIISNVNIFDVKVELKKGNKSVEVISTDDSGNFHFSNIGSGSYILYFNKFASYFSDSIVIEANADSKSSLEINKFLWPLSGGMLIDSISNITDSAADVYFTKFFPDAGNVTEHGICWDSIPGADIADNHITVNILKNERTSKILISNLAASTHYFVRAYYKIFNQYYYSNEISFATSAIPLPQVKSALLVIDVQNAIFPIVNQASVIQNINSLIQKAKLNNVPVIYFQFNDNYGFQNGTGGWMFYYQLNVNSGDEVIQKYYQNSFTGTNLKTRLDNYGVQQIFVTGLQSQYCVKETCKGSLNYKYDVVLVKDAHSTSTSTRNNGTINMVNEQMENLGCILKTAQEINFNN